MDQQLSSEKDSTMGGILSTNDNTPQESSDITMTSEPSTSQTSEMDDELWLGEPTDVKVETDEDFDVIVKSLETAIVQTEIYDVPTDQSVLALANSDTILEDLTKELTPTLSESFKVQSTSLFDATDTIPELIEPDITGPSLLDLQQSALVCDISTEINKGIDPLLINNEANILSEEMLLDAANISNFQINESPESPEETQSDLLLTEEAQDIEDTLLESSFEEIIPETPEEIPDIILDLVEDIAELDNGVSSQENNIEIPTEEMPEMILETVEDGHEINSDLEDEIIPETPEPSEETGIILDDVPETDHPENICVTNAAILKTLEESLGINLEENQNNIPKIPKLTDSPEITLKIIDECPENSQKHISKPDILLNIDLENIPEKNINLSGICISSVKQDQVVKAAKELQVAEVHSSEPVQHLPELKTYLQDEDSIVADQEVVSVKDTNRSDQDLLKPELQVPEASSTNVPITKEILKEKLQNILVQTIPDLVEDSELILEIIQTPENPPKKFEDQVTGGKSPETQPSVEPKTKTIVTEKNIMKIVIAEKSIKNEIKVAGKIASAVTTETKLETKVSVSELSEHVKTDPKLTVIPPETVTPILTLLDIDSPTITADVISESIVKPETKPEIFSPKLKPLVVPTFSEPKLNVTSAKILTHPIVTPEMKAEPVLTTPEINLQSILIPKITNPNITFPEKDTPIVAPNIKTKVTIPEIKSQSIIITPEIKTQSKINPIEKSILDTKTKSSSEKRHVEAEEQSPPKKIKLVRQKLVKPNRKSEVSKNPITTESLPTAAVENIIKEELTLNILEDNINETLQPTTVSELKDSTPDLNPKSKILISDDLTSSENKSVKKGKVKLRRNYRPPETVKKSVTLIKKMQNLLTATDQLPKQQEKDKLQNIIEDSKKQTTELPTPEVYAEKELNIPEVLPVTLEVSKVLSTESNISEVLPVESNILTVLSEDSNIPEVLPVEIEDPKVLPLESKNSEVNPVEYKSLEVLSVDFNNTEVPPVEIEVPIVQSIESKLSEIIPAESKILLVDSNNPKDLPIEFEATKVLSIESNISEVTPLNSKIPEVEPVIEELLNETKTPNESRDITENSSLEDINQKINSELNQLKLIENQKIEAEHFTKANVKIIEELELNETKSFEEVEEPKIMEGITEIQQKMVETPTKIIEKDVLESEVLNMESSNTSFETEVIISKPTETNSLAKVTETIENTETVIETMIVQASGEDSASTEKLESQTVETEDLASPDLIKIEEEGSRLSEEMEPLKIEEKNPDAEQATQKIKLEDSEIKISETPTTHVAESINIELRQISDNIKSVDVLQSTQVSEKILDIEKLQQFIPQSSTKKSKRKSAPIESIIKPLMVQVEDLESSSEEYESKLFENYPKIVIKPIPKPDQPRSPKITIKPIIKPPELIQKELKLKEEASTPRITIKPVVKSDPLKITITKQKFADTHSILKIYKPGDEDYVPKLTIKPVSKEDMLHSPRLNIKPVKSASPKITVKPVLPPNEVQMIQSPKMKSNPEESYPKVTIKPILRPESNQKLSQLSPRQLKMKGMSFEASSGITLEPIPSQSTDTQINLLKISVKPFAKLEEALSPKLSIKPITKTCEIVHSEDGSSNPLKLTIKPILKPEESYQSPKITIKPILKPDEEDDKPERIILKIQKSNLPSPSGSKDSHESDKKLDKIKLKLTKEGSHAQIIPSGEQFNLKRSLNLSDSGILEKRAKTEFPGSELLHSSDISINLVSPNAKPNQKQITEEVTIVKIDKSGSISQSAQIYKSKIKDMLLNIQQKPNITCTPHIEQDYSSSSDDVKIVEVVDDPVDDPLLLHDESSSQDVMIVSETLNVNPFQNVQIINAHSITDPLVQSPKKRGRPRKNPLEVKPELKDEDCVEVVRPKRTCRAPPGRTPFAVKERKPRGARARGVSRGRGASRGSSIPKEPKPLRGKALKQAKALAKLEAARLKQEVIIDEITIEDSTNDTTPAATPVPPADDSPKKSEIKEELEPDVVQPSQMVEPNEKIQLNEELNCPPPVAVYEDETRMSADCSSRAQTPARQVVNPPAFEGPEESQSSVQSTATTESNKNKKGRLEICDPDSAITLVDQIVEYSWSGGGPYMLQEQIAQYLGVKSFKRKYPGLTRRPVEMQERDYIREKGLVSESMCDMGLTAVPSSEILDIMYTDFQEKYEEYRKCLRDKQSKEITNKQKAISLATSQEKNKIDFKERAIRSAANWNLSFNKGRKESRKCCMDLQTFTINFPSGSCKVPQKAPVGKYPIALVPGQFTDYYKSYTTNDLKYLPLNSVKYGPVLPNQQSPDLSDGTVSDSESSSGSDSESSDESMSSIEETSTILKPPPLTPLLSTPKARVH